MIIPTHGRPGRLARCVDHIARQAAPPGSFEVLVGLDGPDDASESAALEAWRTAGGPPGALRVLACPREGLNATRNRLLELATGRLLLSLNDDVIPDTGCLGAHIDAHREAAARLGGPAIVVGHSPFLERPDATVFDLLCEETSMLFFYDRMLGSDDAWRDWGYRHCWGLNFSAPLDLVRRVGGFTAFPLLYGYDDIEIAWRMRRETGRLPVLFRRAALAPHDHRHTPEEVLERECRLGHTAWHFAGRNPPFAADLFGRDIRSEGELRYSREFIERERPLAERMRASFVGLAGMPAGALGGATPGHRAGLVTALYEQHLLLKRWQWRRGLLAAAEGREPRFGEVEPAAQAAAL